MKRKLLLLISLVSFQLTFASTILETNWRWRNDDGNETTATWIAPDSTGIEVSDTTKVLRLRIRLDNTYTDPKNATSVLKYTTTKYISKSEISNGAWTELNTSSATNAFVLVSSAFVNDGDATTRQIPSFIGKHADSVTVASYAFLPGKIFNSGVSSTYSVPVGNTSEVEFCIRATGRAEVGKTYYFVMKDVEVYAEDGVSLPRLTIVNSAPVFTSAATKNLDLPINANSVLDSLLVVNDPNSGQTITWTVLSDPKNGILSGFPANTVVNGTAVTPTSISYSPNSGYSGKDSVSVNISDGIAGTSKKIVFNIANGIPAFAELSNALNINENAAATSINDLLKVSDANADQTLTWAVVKSPENGTLAGFPTALATNKGEVIPSNLTYISTANYSGTDTFSISVSDGITSDIIGIKVTVAEINKTPEFVKGASQQLNLKTNEESALDSLLVVKDLNNLQSLIWTVISAPKNGSIAGLPDTIASNRANVVPVGVVYTPNSGVAGLDSVTVKVSDGTDTAYTKVVITIANEIPVFTSSIQELSVVKNSSATSINAILKAEDVNSNQILTWSVFKVPVHGSLSGFPYSLTSNEGEVSPSNLSYVAENNYAGKDTFSIILSDGITTDTVEIKVVVIEENSAPEFTKGLSQQLNMTLNATVSLNSNLEVNDLNSGQSLTWSVFSAPKNGSIAGLPVSLASNAAKVSPSGINYAPAKGFSGKDSITVIVSDGIDSAYTKLVFTIANAIPSFTAASQSFTVLENATAISINTMLKVSDANANQSLTWSVLTASIHSVLTGFPYSVASNEGEVVPSALNYAPVANFYGNDVFSIVVSDGITSDTTEISVVVTEINKAPQFVKNGAQSVNLALNASVSLDKILEVLDLNNAQTLTWSVLSEPKNGTVVGLPATANSNRAAITPSGASYKAAKGFSGKDSIVVKVSDGTSEVSLKVLFVVANGTPSFVSKTNKLTVLENADATSIVDFLKVEDVNANQSLTWSVLVAPKNGTLSGFPATLATNEGVVIPSNLTYKSNKDFAGNDAFSVLVSDGVSIDTFEVSVVIDLVEAVNSASKVGMSVYPNPATEFVHIKNVNSDSRIAIVDMSGKLVKSVNMQTSTSDVAISVSDLKKGYYSIIVSSKNNSNMFEFIKK